MLMREDHATIQERDGTKTVYILLPYFRRGNLQDAINANLVNHTSFPEIDLLKLFRGVCVAVEQLHEYRLVAVPTRRNDAPTMEEEPLMDEGVVESEEEVGEVVPYAHRDIKPGTPQRPPIVHRLVSIFEL
jgi:serine/threonine kinase 16